MQPDAPLRMSQAVSHCLAHVFAQLRAVHRLLLDQPVCDGSPSQPHVLKMPQADDAKATVRIHQGAERDADEDEESFGSGIL